MYVGASVFIQGDLVARNEQARRALSDGNSIGRHVNQASYTLAVFGTLFAAFGDLLPADFYYGVPMCRR